MNSATWILIGEWFLISVSLVIAIAVYGWRKKKRMLTALDVLLTNLSKAEPERKTTLIERLKKSYHSDAAKVELLIDEIFRAERQFIQKLIQLLLNSGTDKIARFNEDMYALLTPYWELLPLNHVADSLPVEQSGDSTAIPPVIPESASDGLPSEDYDLEVTVATEVEEDAETGSTSTLTGSTSDIENDEDDVVGSNDVADQPKSIQGPSEADQGVDADHAIPGPPAKDLTAVQVVDDSSAASAQDQSEQNSESIESGDQEGYESFVADMAEDEYLAEEATDNAEVEEDEPSWGDAFDEVADLQEDRVINLDQNDDEDVKTKKVPEI